MDSRATLQQALRTHQAGNFAEAERMYRAVLQQEPLNATALHHLGLIAKEAGHHKAALELIGQSISLDPSNVAFRVNQIGVLDHVGQRQGAEDAARKLIEDRPLDLKLRADLARLLVKYAKFKDASEQWEFLVSRAPDDAAVLFHSAHTLEQLSEVKRAEQRYEEALRIKPDFPEAMLQLSNIYFRTARLKECTEMLRKVIALDPRHVAALTTLANVSLQAGKLDEGLVYATKARDLAPNNTEAVRAYAFAKLSRGELPEATRAYEQGVAIAPQSLDAYSELLYSRSFLDTPGEEDLTQHRGFQSRAARLIQCRPPAARQRMPGDRLRIGYVSPDLHGHPVGFFIEPLILNHDRGRFEVQCFSNTGAPDALTDRLRGAVDKFHDIEPGALTFDQLDAMVRAEQIDVLIDLTGHTNANCLRLFARKPAPVQVTYLGYPNTTGLDAIDFRITDAVADPQGNDAFHSERLLRLPDSFGLFKAPLDAPPVGPPPHQPNGFVTFGTVARIEKWSPLTLASWARILGAVPDAHFRLIGAGYELPEHRAFVLEKLRSAGIDPSRIQLVGRKPFVEYLAEVSNTDLLLDTHPFNGHTTTLQALYMGVPTVTMAGTTHRSRMGTSILTALGMPELIGDSPEAYERIAVELARNPTRLTEIRMTLRDRLLHSPLCDAPRFARAFETLLLQAWQGRKPSQGQWDITT